MFITPDQVYKLQEFQTSFNTGVWIDFIRERIHETLLKGRTRVYLHSTSGDMGYVIDLKDSLTNKTLREELQESGWTIKPSVIKIKVWNWRKFRMVEVEKTDDGFYELIPFKKE